MGAWIIGIINISDVALNEGIGAGDTFLVEGLFSPFALDGSQMIPEPLPVSVIIDF